MHFRQYLLLALLLLAPAAPLLAQRAMPSVAAPPRPASPAVELLSRAEVEQRLAAVPSLAELNEATRKTLSDLYQQVLAELDKAADATRRAGEFAQFTSDAPAEVERIRGELAKPVREPKPEVAEGATLQQIEQALTQATADLQTARTRAAELQSEATRRDERRGVIPDQLARARQQLAELPEGAASPAGAVEPAVVTEARRLLAQTRRQALAREIEAIEAEMASYDARRDLLPARRDLANRRTSEAERLVPAWQEVVSRQRQREAEQASRDAQRMRREGARQHPVINEYADKTASLAQERASTTGVSSRIDSTTQKVASARADLNALRERFRAIQRRVEASGLMRGMGQTFRREFETLPDEGKLRRQRGVIDDELAAAEFALVERQDERLEAGDVDGTVARLLAALGEPAPGENRADIEAVTRELVIARRDLLDQMVADSRTYLDRLVELDDATADLLEATGNYRTFIGERVLWVPSVTGDEKLLGGVRDMARRAAPAAWERLWRDLVADVRANWPSVAASGAMLGLLIAVSVWTRRRVRRLGEQVASYRTDSYLLTVRVLILTIVRGTAIPAALLWVSWLLGRPEGRSELAGVLSAALATTGIVLFPLEALRQALRPRGLAEAHFRWPAAAIKSIRRHLRWWFLPLLMPFVFIQACAEAMGDDAVIASVGRMAFTGGLLTLAAFVLVVLRPARPGLAEFLRANRSGWINRLRLVWFPLALVLPVGLVVLSWLGYHYTALQLELRLERTLALSLGLVLANGMLLRWLFVERRRVAVEEARRKREQRLAEAAAASGAAESEAAPSPPIAAPMPFDEEKVDLPAISAQTRQLFRTGIALALVFGLFFIWADVLPALRMLDRVQLWPTMTIIEVSELDEVTGFELIAAKRPVDKSPDRSGAATPPATPAAGASGTTPPIVPGASESSASPAEAVMPITLTLADAGACLVILAMTWIAFRNMPGLLEIAVLQRLPLDAGARYALGTVFRYLIAIVGILFAFSAISIGWSNVQWLAAALTFGLAFGLQEIFANFVSGLIILGERPVRLGDTVTVGTVSGTVTRIRMRATTIVDWDRKETIIPNKTIITGEVINWTLSDSVLRVIIPVGVSYGADVDLVDSLLLEIAKRHKLVLADPAPSVLFKSFADSSLLFELRVFIPGIEHFVRVRHEMHMVITKEFRKAGIEIAFPQRDLHVRSIGDLAKLVDRRGDESEREIASAPERVGR